MKTFVIIAALVGGWILAFNQHMIADGTFFGGFLWGAGGLVLLWLVRAPFAFRRVHAQRKGKVDKLIADGWKVSHTIYLGSLIVVVDSARRRWALLDAQLHEVFDHEQFQEVEYEYDGTKMPGRRLRFTLRTKDPKRLVFRTWALGDVDRAKDMIHQVVVALEA